MARTRFKKAMKAWIRRSREQETAAALNREREWEARASAAAARRQHVGLMTRLQQQHDEALAEYVIDHLRSQLQ